MLRLRSACQRNNWGQSIKEFLAQTTGKVHEVKGKMEQQFNKLPAIESTDTKEQSLEEVLAELGKLVQSESKK